MPLATIQYQDEEGYIFDVYYDVDEEGEIIISEVVVVAAKNDVDY